MGGKSKGQRKDHRKFLIAGTDYVFNYLFPSIMTDYLLYTDATQISSISSMRVMVAAALLYTFTVLTA